ncbi:hypothetical protein [Sphingomonas cavernae]|uniref:Lipoprotein n=1 Tax=Sphingomonas cavernae TaxID=2320861 RepID=A0A418WK69_9SPHN|nr:hypothetical protein [Sphingomonas cavernae]RJF90418.1 hypothetical protein D3876_09225 [Sphingomonas cavernae]
MIRAGLLWAGTLALMLVACGETAKDNAVAPVDGESAGVNAAIPSPAMLNSVLPQRTPTAAPVAGSFAAVSNTAMSVTGDVTIAADTLSFSLDQSYGTGGASVTTAASPYAGADIWADLFGVTADTPVEIRPVTSEQVGAKARNGGLCGKAKASFVAIARKAAGTPDELLQIAAFQGPAAPGNGASPDSLCGTYTYMPKGN